MGELGHAPQEALCKGAELWNYKIWLLLANWHLHCRQWYFYTLNTPPVLGAHPLTVSAPQSHRNQCVHQETYTVDRTYHSSVQDPYCPVTVLLAIAIQCFALFTCFQILHEIWSFDSQENLYICSNGCQILRLKCTKFKFGWGSTPDLDEELTVLPQISGAYF